MDYAFNKLKNLFNIDEVLLFTNPDKEFIVETDVSDFAIGCVLSQKSDKDNLLHPMAFHSKSLNKTEMNYTIYDKELLNIITAFEVWKHHLEGIRFPIQQIVWCMYLSKFDFRIAYRHGAKGGKPDALSRKPGYKLASLSDLNTIIKMLFIVLLEMIIAVARLRLKKLTNFAVLFFKKSNKMIIT